MKKLTKQTDANKEWMASGKMGCTFGALFAKNPASVNWVTQVNPDRLEIPDGAILLSLQFPGKSAHEVEQWALLNGFYTEDYGSNGYGVRLKVDAGVSWVQYFGPDSHVKTRQAPTPELMLCVRVPAKIYWRVGFSGILHVAHSYLPGLTKRVADGLWFSSYRNTEKQLGHRPGKSEAAKITFK